MPESSPWLTSEQASELLKSEFNVSLSPRTIENKWWDNDIPSHLIAGQRRVHRDDLRKWALPTGVSE